MTGATRSEALPYIPTVGEFVPGYDASFWFGIGSPKNMPTEIVDQLNMEINAGLADPRVKARICDLGGASLAGLPSDFGELITDDTEKTSRRSKNDPSPAMVRSTLSFRNGPYPDITPPSVYTVRWCRFV
jgi:tripartite-type tricarboxylate transporter receptor subunit TctC